MKMSRKELEKIRGHEIRMIFQEPMTTLNPVVKIETQITECLPKTMSSASCSVSFGLCGGNVSGENCGRDSGGGVFQKSSASLYRYFDSCGARGKSGGSQPGIYA